MWTMTKRQINALARRITDAAFTGRENKAADRLILVAVPCEPLGLRTELGGWGRMGLQSVVSAILTEALVRPK